MADGSSCCRVGRLDRIGEGSRIEPGVSAADRELPGVRL